MNQIDTIPSEISGYWLVPGVPGKKEPGIIHISHDAHAVDIVRISGIKNPVVDLYWYDRDEDGRYIVRGRPNKPGWKVSILRDDDTLLVKNGKRRFRLERIKKEDLDQSDRMRFEMAYKRIHQLEEESHL